MIIRDSAVLTGKFVRGPMVAAFIASLAIGSAVQAQTDDPAPKLRRGYADMRYGQLHYTMASPAPGAAGASQPPIVFFHQSPNSSAEFAALVRELGRDRVAIAIDTPGYGGSDGPEAQPMIADYSRAIAEGLRSMGYGPQRRVDVFGYHTGSKIATQLAVDEPSLVRKVILSGVLVSTQAEADERLKKLVHPTSASDLFEKFCAALPRYRQMYSKRGLPESAWAAIRIDSMRPQQRQEYGHEAAYLDTPQFAARMSKVRQPTLLIAMDDGLAQGTRDARGFFDGNAVVEPHEFSAGAFFTETKRMADVVRAFQDSPNGKQRSR